MDSEGGLDRSAAERETSYHSTIVKCLQVQMVHAKVIQSVEETCETEASDSETY